MRLRAKTGACHRLRLGIATKLPYLPRVDRARDSLVQCHEGSLGWTGPAIGLNQILDRRGLGAIPRVARARVVRVRVVRVRVVRVRVVRVRVRVRVVAVGIVRLNLVRSRALGWSMPPLPAWP